MLLATNMLEVWQAKYPSSEISAQMLFVGSLLGLVVALTTRWRPAAGAAGLLTGIGFLDRADGVLLIGLAVAALAAIIAVRRWDARATWFAVGLAIVLPHAFWQAYSYDAAGRYSSFNSVPSLPKLLAVIVVLLVVGLVLRTDRPPRRRPGSSERRVQFGVGAVITVIAAGLVALGFLRPRLFGASYGLFGGVRARTFDDQIMSRLSWFISIPGFALMLIGLAIVGLRRWGGALWVLTVPLLLIFPVYAYKTHNSTRLMWWTRRFLPTVLPLVMVLIALALGVALTLRHPACRRLPGLARRSARLGRCGSSRSRRSSGCCRSSCPSPGRCASTRNSPGPSRSAAASPLMRVASRASSSGSTRRPAACTPSPSSASAIWLERGQVSALLPYNASLDAGYVRKFRRVFRASRSSWSGTDRVHPTSRASR